MALLGRRIAAERIRRGWSKSDLARKAGLDPSYVTRLEAAKFEHPAFDKIQAVAGAFRVEVTTLTDPPPPEDRADELQLRRLLARKLHGSQKAADILADAIDAASAHPAPEARTILTVVQELLPSLHATDD